jgi:hypothetical protein
VAQPLLDGLRPCGASDEQAFLATVAWLMLDELERWKAFEIIRYHAERHSSLGISLLAAWHEAAARRAQPVRHPYDLPNLYARDLDRTDPGPNGAFRTMTVAHKTIAAVRKLEVLHRLEEGLRSRLLPPKPHRCACLCCRGAVTPSRFCAVLREIGQTSKIFFGVRCKHALGPSPSIR